MQELSREEIKALLLQEDFLRFQAKAVRAFGPAAGILCRHLLFWDEKGWDERGFIYRSETEIEELEGLVRNQFRQARKKLREASVLEEERRPGLPPRNYYRLNLHRLADNLFPPDPTLTKNSGSVETVGSLDVEADGSLDKEADAHLDVEADGSLDKEAPGSLDIHKQRQETSAEVSTEVSSRGPTLQVAREPDFRVPEPRVERSKSSLLKASPEFQKLRQVVEEARRHDPQISEEALLKIVTSSLISHRSTAKMYLSMIVEGGAA